MILLWGLAEDSPLAAVRRALDRLGIPAFFVDQRKILDTTLDLEFDEDCRGQLRVGDSACELEAVSAAYVRPYDSRRLRAVAAAGEHSAAWRHTVLLYDALGAWLDVTPALVVNPPSAMASNDSKPYQASLIRAAGFAVPDTLITTDPAAARRFWESQGAVIYKSISGVRSVVSRLTAADTGRLANVRWCPTQFQRYIPGHDIRVHVVGDDLFACEVRCEADDYRYASCEGTEVEIRACTLAADCSERCHALALSLGLVVAGLDLRRTADGQWYCFEVNPSPAFTYYQAATGQPIAEAIAALLARRLDDG